MYYCYILKSLNHGLYYIGSSGNTSTRICGHNKGLVGSTKRYKPWILIYEERFKTRGEAVKRERQIKSWKSRRAIERLISKNKIENPR